MDPVIASSLVSGAGSLAGGLVDNYFNQKASNKSYKFQKKVLQNQIQWRVADAVKAGIHPLAALGVNPASGPSISVGSSSLGSALSDMGQNLGRAAEAYLTPDAKNASRAALLTEENIGLQNDLLRAQIAGAQKALLTQGSTPGVASMIGNIATSDVNRAQTAQNWGGEFVGDAVGLLGALSDWWQTENKKAPVGPWLESWLTRGGSFNRRSASRSSGGGGW